MTPGRREGAGHAGGRRSRTSARRRAATPLPAVRHPGRVRRHPRAGSRGAAELARQAGLAGKPIEDYDGERIRPLPEAVERIVAAAEAAHGADAHLVLTGRAENFIRGNKDLADTIARLQAYAEAGADVLDAPGPVDVEEIRTIVSEVDRPVNVLARNGAPPVAELAQAGVARISIGGGFAYAAIGGAVEAAREFMEAGTYGFWERAGAGAKAAFEAFDAAVPTARGDA